MKLLLYDILILYLFLKVIDFFILVDIWRFRDNIGCDINIML